MLTLYMDESGFTGEDLMSASQPIFVHVSTMLSDEESMVLNNEYFKGVQASELKHKNLSKRPRGQDRLARFIADTKGNGKFTAWLCHKEFTLLTYLVDLWVEPAMRQDGIDLYRDGANLGLCNMAYYCLRTFQSDHFLSGHLRRFQRMMIQRTQKSYREFWGRVFQDYHRVDKRTKDILVFFLGGEMKLGYEQLRKIPKRALDPALTTLFETCSHWRKRTDEPLKVVHDKSSSLARDKWLWDMISSPALEERTIGVPGRQTTFPLNVIQTEVADSRSHLQLQLCDLVAGATAAWCRQFIDQSPPEDYVKRLGAAGTEELIIGQIWPSPEVEPDELGMKGWSGELVNFMSDQLTKLAKKPR